LAIFLNSLRIAPAYFTADAPPSHCLLGLQAVLHLSSLFSGWRKPPKVINKVGKSGRKCTKVAKFFHNFGLISAYIIMATFLGDIDCKLDTKGRFLFPSAMRKQLGAECEDVRFVVKKSIFKPCLELHPISEWEDLVGKITKKLNAFNKQHNAFLSQFHRGVSELSLDSSGRLLLPKRLMDQAGIAKDIILSGVGSMIEVWDMQAYEAGGLTDTEFEALASDVLGDGYSLD
jgi:MraZ protein